MDTKAQPLNSYPAGEEIERLKREEEQKCIDAENGVRARTRNRKAKRDKARVCGHGTNFTPKKKKRKK